MSVPPLLRSTPASPPAHAATASSAVPSKAARTRRTDPGSAEIAVMEGRLGLSARPLSIARECARGNRECIFRHLVRGVRPADSRTGDSIRVSGNAIEIRNVVKRYANHVAVRDLSLIVPRGSVYGLLGPNGAGKTTTIRMVLNIIVPDEGTITVLGEPHRTAGMTDRMGYLPEERGLYKKMQVKRVLRFLAELKGVPKREAERRIEDWLERLQLKTAEKDWGLSKID